MIDNLNWENIQLEIKSSDYKRTGTSLGTAMKERQFKGIAMATMRIRTWTADSRAQAKLDPEKNKVTWNHRAYSKTRTKTKSRNNFH
jgi:hypothetical protein